MPPPTGPISPIRFEKSIAQLPATLTSSTLYAVRVGEGFDLYISDLTGNIAYRTNATIGPTGYTGSASTATGYTGSTGTQGEIGFTGSTGIQGQSFTFRGEWADPTTYSAYDVVTFGGESYVALSTVQGFQPYYTQLWTKIAAKGTQGYTGSTGTQGVIGYTGSKGDQGGFGGAAFDYVYSTDTTVTDPGPGQIEFNTLLFSTSTTELYINYNDSLGDSLYTYLQTIDDSTSNIKGHFSVAEKANPTNSALFAIVGSHTEEGGPPNNHFHVPIAYLSGTTSFSPNTEVVVTFARTGDRGDIGYTGSQGEIGPAPATTVYTAQSMTLTNGVYVSGDVTSIQNFNDGQRYALTDGSLTGPAWIVNVDFTEVTSFNQVDLNISYTVSSGHTVFIQLYNNTTEGWDNIGSYNGLAGYQQFQLGVISGTSYINSGTVLLRLYHNNTGNPAHQTFIDYVAIVDSIAGGQGPRGATGYTGSTGTQGVIGYTGSTGTQGIAGYTGSVGYTGSIGTQGEIGYTGSSGLLGNIGLYDSINETVSGTVNNISSLNFDKNSGFSLTDLGSGSVNVRVAISASSTTSPLKTFNIIGEFGILTGTARYFPSTDDTIVSAIISTGSMATQDIVAGLYRNGEFVQFFIIPAGQYFTKYRGLNISIFSSEFYTVNMVGGQGKDLSLALYNTNIQ